MVPDVANAIFGQPQELAQESHLRRRAGQKQIDGLRHAPELQGESRARPIDVVTGEIVTRDGKRVPANVWSLGALPQGLEISGPAILAGPDATGLIEPGWRGVVHLSGAVMVERA
jgi:N-methylhydantoinase A/oxoprolinase/acetone carboxylase beta subunit